MAKHTPGPWKVSADGHVLTEFVDDAILVRTGDESRDADARLIAAAPELLAALRKLADECADDGPSVKAMVGAVAAIRKAEGE